MKAATVLSLAAAAVAAPLTQRAEGPNYFTGISLRSASDIHFLSVNANGLQFWLNKPTATYCPANAGVSCPPADDPASTTTTFAGGDDTLGLRTTVPGGQRVYVNSKGLLKFTQAHSGTMDPDSTATGFSIDDAGNLLFEGQSWYACNLGEAYNNSYSIYAVSKTAEQDYGSACEGFSFRTSPASENSTATWQYT